MTTREISCSSAVMEALTEEMERDPAVFVIGEDLTAQGGIFGQFTGLPERFPGRIIDAPISETAIVGAGVGAALTGMRPLVDMHFADFVTTAMDEIVNQMAKIRYMFGGQASVPMVLWAPDGGGLRAAAHHSQCLESWFVHTPGLKVVSPSEPADVKGLLKAALRDDDPVIFFQHKRLFAQKGPVPEGEYVIPIGKAEVKRPGRDISIITYSRMTYLSLEAAKILSEKGIEAEVIDLRTLKPLDFPLIAESVKKTYRAMVVHEACLTGGFGAEIAARIGEELFDWLDAPVTRIGAKDVPMPFNPAMEDFVMPQTKDIVEGALRLIGRDGGLK
ncbi:MAG: alpha-ketoacid dehydrogenase subunit beta [Deltaproteobacteria bacterium CG_4_9_14_3_um_filter_51_14]|nr:alpha-ketoacid dehydrogenase subunit beta [bacterium]NCP09142.1 alpha-ketoacid dehydrogenase subunit beta [bacterium]OIP38757.1 MAG: alpha-ketoacid dehydrogenase subunit beta [Desulfobacteraceae bacterium CG2_30_51_40]PJB35431.1 MAG: alpha-ketoacid dehydrogenase subunit beta [Deltaproteobacteria bacterium CG_4_9_14_3_um_filter_51_14]